VRCNERIKFGRLWEHARRLGAEAVATGHYARIEAVAGRWCPRVAADRVKDQTYFLFSLTQEQLAAARFPVGGLTKPQVRSESRRRGLATADKRESQDICFVGKGGLADFLRQAVPEAFVPGPVVLADGTVLGKHAGLAAYTIGQRKGLGVAWREPLFVVRLDLPNRTVVLGPRAALLVSELPLRDCTWHHAAPSVAGLECLVRPRYRTPPVPATIVPAAGVGPEGKPNAVVRFQQPQPRPSPGQAGVAYDLAGELCLGGGWFA
jgi:tRNA-uridine 2-sulfurtransferase